MKPAPEEPADLSTRLRQQLILAQVRIMELEDSRDELVPRLAGVEQLLGQAQKLVEQKMEAATHLEQVRVELQAQYDHLQHVQHVTNTALEATRTEVSTLQDQVSALLTETEALHTLTQQLASTEQAQRERLKQQAEEINALRDESTTRLARINTLDAEIRAMKASRSWRWTAWLRSWERLWR